MKFISHFMLPVMLLVASAQARELAINQVAIDSINREARKFTGQACIGAYKVLSGDFKDATPETLQTSYNMMVQSLEDLNKRFSGVITKKSLPQNNVARLWLTSKNGSAFMMQALQNYEGKPQIITYGCQLR